MEQNPTSQITFAFGKMSFHQPELKNVVPRKQHSSYSKEYLHNFIFLICIRNEMQASMQFSKDP